MYKCLEIVERHRHRYEVNPLFKEHAEKADLNIVGTSVDGNLVEMVELPNHKWFLGCQFHLSLLQILEMDILFSIAILRVQ